MLDLSTILKHYKRKEVQDAIIDAARDREIAVKFGEKGFGKRPDVLKYPTDVLEFAKQGATSFHCSEERWVNPLQIGTNLRKQEMDSLRTGWDLVLDIDCPNWTLAKITAHLIVKALKDHGIKSISAKFSGNKGFHIGVPFESMPGMTRSRKTAALFPDGPRSIAAYLIDYISKNYTKVTENSVVEFGNADARIPLNKIISITGKAFDEVTSRICADCGKEIKGSTDAGTQFVCSRCETSAKGSAGERIKKCPKCGSIMERIESRKALCSCGSNSYKIRFNPASIVEVDTILISPRHLYRMPYSLHEKSGLASVPLEPGKVMQFEKEMAKPGKIDFPRPVFLDGKAADAGEAENLLMKSLHYSENIPGNETGNENKANIEEIHFEKAVPKELFPPCIKNILNGIEDGKKRSVFVLLNFLTNLGWDYEKIEELLKDWNKKNPEQLREVNLLGQLRYHKQNKKQVLPPNCSNKSYYKDFGVCKPDNLCSKIKNPVSYSIRKARFLSTGKKPKKDDK